MFPTRLPGIPPPPGYKNKPPKPLGGVYFEMCNGQLQAINKWKVEIRVCAPDGTQKTIVKSGEVRIAAGDPRGPIAKAKAIATALRAMEMKVGKTILKADANGNPLKMFGPGGVVVNTRAAGNIVHQVGNQIVAEVCAAVNQAILDCGWAVDSIGISFDNFTGSTIPVRENDAAATQPDFPQTTVTLPAAPNASGTMSLMFFDPDDSAQGLLQYDRPFVGGAAPEVILSDLRDQINLDNGSAQLVGKTLRISRVSLEPLGLMTRGPYLLAAGALDNPMTVEVDTSLSTERLSFLNIVPTFSQQGLLVLTFLIVAVTTILLSKRHGTEQSHNS